MSDLVTFLPNTYKLDTSSTNYNLLYCTFCDNLIRFFIKSQKAKKFKEIIVEFFMCLNLSFLRLLLTYRVRFFIKTKIFKEIIVALRFHEFFFNLSLLVSRLASLRAQQNVNKCCNRKPEVVLSAVTEPQSYGQSTLHKSWQKLKLRKLEILQIPK